METKQTLKVFEDLLNKAKVNAYSKISLKQPLSSSGLKDYKEAFCNCYGYSKEDLEIALKGRLNKNGKNIRRKII